MTKKETVKLLKMIHLDIQFEIIRKKNLKPEQFYFILKYLEEIIESLKIPMADEIKNSKIINQIKEFIKSYGYTLDDLYSENYKGNLAYLRTAIVHYLKLKGYADEEVAKIINRDRTTIHYHKKQEISEKYNKRLFKIYNNLLEVAESKEQGQ